MAHTVSDKTKRIALVDGCFDPFHPGHIRYLTEARKIAYDLAENAYVVCQVASDEYISTKHVPLLSQEERSELVSHYVDDLYVDNTPTPETIIALRPSLYIKGTDWRTRLPHDIVNACKAVGCRIEYTNTITHSSSQILDKYREATELRGLMWLEDFIANQDIPFPETFSKEYFTQQGFSLDKRREIEGKHPSIIKGTFYPQKVLDFGCGPGNLVTLLKEAGIECVHGWDVSPEWKNDELAPPYDLVICREVLEHVPVAEYADSVKTLCDLSSRYVYVTTRFHPEPKHLFDVKDHDDLDPTHISLTNKTLLRALFVLEGFRRRPRLEKQIDHMNKGRCLVYERQ